jgi:splicing factor 3A subunit 3
VKPKVNFTGDENNGKNVDLNLAYEAFLNLPQKIGEAEMAIPSGFERCNYITYLSKFEKLFSVSRASKLNPSIVQQYRSYIGQLFEYLVDFFARVNPLVDTSKLMEMIKEDFDKRWDLKAITGWFEKEDDSSAEFSSASADPLFCQACKKGFAKETVFQSHLSGKKHKAAVEAGAGAAAAAGRGDAAAAGGAASQTSPRRIAEIEEYIFRFAELLRSQINDTISQIEKKQTRTPEEIAKEQEDADKEHGQVTVIESSSDDDEDKPIYNPLNLPLGWDGKPIPFWLYKLHGLNIEYKCEICGGYGYWGPRAWERHFTEWRHTYGMRCLGIPNSREFRNITKFEDAMALYNKLQERKKQAEWVAEEGEECEDREGNVFNKKTYEDLKRQGII